jgi:formate dehydrogenase major subunit
VDIVTLPLYYGLTDGAWKHWARVWDVPYEWFVDRFDAVPAKGGREARTPEQNMQVSGIPSTRWFDATLLDAEEVDQKDRLRAMMVFGHGGNTIPRMADAQRGMAALDLLVVADPHPTTFAALENRPDNTYLLPICTQLECSGSRTASNRSIQWGEKVVDPIFESANDYWVMYKLAEKLGFSDLMFKNIAMVEGKYGPEPEPESVLREINRGGWSTGYCGQSPERIKAHMANQGKFDLVTLRAPMDDPEVGGDYYGLPWPCWGTPEMRHPGSPILYNTNLHVKDGGGTFRARFGVEHEGVSLLASGS